MKKILTILVTLFLFSFVAFPASMAAEEINKQSALKKYGQDFAKGIVQDVVIDNVTRLAGPICDLYGLSIELLFSQDIMDNAWNSFEFPLYRTLAELSVLFRSEPWRELIWALNDKREEFKKLQLILRKRECLLTVATEGGNLLQKKVGEKAGIKFFSEDMLLRFEQDLLETKRKLAELKAKIDYFAFERERMVLTGSSPLFQDVEESMVHEKAKEEFEPMTPIETDKIFYWLFDPQNFKEMWNQILRSLEKVGTSGLSSIVSVIDVVPEDCLKLVDPFLDIQQHFFVYFSFSTEKGKYVNDEGEEYDNFAEFVDKNKSNIKEKYLSWCKKQKEKPPETELTEGEKQYEKLLKSIDDRFKVLGERLIAIEEPIFWMERKKLAKDIQKETQKLEDLEWWEKRIHGLRYYRGTILAQIDFYSTVIKSVGNPENESLTKLTKSITDLMDAITGVDDESQKTLVKRLAERIEKSKERKLKKICSRLEDMYRKTNRDTAYLPTIGVANGKTYCQAKPTCEDLALSNSTGFVDGFEKYMRCVGGIPGLREEAEGEQPKGADIASMLEQKSYQELMKMRQLYFQFSYARYDTLYKAQNNISQLLNQILQDVETVTYDESNRKNYISPEKGANDTVKNHYNMLGTIYHDFYQFMNNVEGSCDAKENLEE